VYKLNTTHWYCEPKNYYYLNSSGIKDFVANCTNINGSYSGNLYVEVKETVNADEQKLFHCQQKCQMNPYVIYRNDYGNECLS